MELPELTEREREIVALVVSGRKRREVAEQLGLSHKTVDARLSSVFVKWRVSSVVELLRVWHQGKEAGT